ncbi:adenine specific DNA methyltransferase (plasmid) [Azospirillum sp. B510]|uniref:type ISP restriction/modification enzyme n=1 Tax=Azospirillum sp. (strain B510) TaxID=137722 RepID=UPI0001C4C65A|nr:type ISP restriction/modification enzyme [Azospirillum sp. B510]BAI75011.1 adenine specific DNA methyltransferase [Azospirillum sp. B510]
MDSAVETYLRRMAEIRGTGAAAGETSYYGALETLLNEIGRTLKPRVMCNGQIRNQGAGHPDFGLYTQDQCAKGEPKKGQGETPERGVIEVKAASDDSWQTADGDQVSKYWKRYGLVLVTNYRQFIILGTGDRGQPAKLESFSLFDTEVAFWEATRKPRMVGPEQRTRFVEFLRRALLLKAPITTARDLAWLLASYAREALARVEAAELPALAILQTALEQALGMRFEGAKGHHFFRSTLVQTLFYGVFSAWVMWSRQQPPGSKALFDWKSAGWSLHVPMVRNLYDQVAQPSRLGPLGLTEVLNWTGDALARVDRPAFFSAFDAGQAVQYFYEPFLAAFDPELRKDLGVWYTPPEVVTYMVERVDRVLRGELGVKAGLADPRVHVLDPCCGTGSFVIAVLDKIRRNLAEGGAGALTALRLKEAATERVFGFEIMPAPFVIAHWQIGFFLAALGVPLDGATGERAAVYLTNALTGWEPPAEPKTRLLFPELEAERDAADHVKREVPILVILGNPPYNAFAGTSPPGEDGLVAPYKEGLAKVWGIRKFNLDDLYVRFLRLAERQIGERADEGVVCYITNHSYIGDPSYVVARQRLLTGFDRIWIDGLNGDSRETGKLTPDGKPDPSVFSTEFNREGIRAGTAVGLFVRTARHDPPKILYRDFWGTAKREELAASLDSTAFDAAYGVAVPEPGNRFSFRPVSGGADRENWASLVEFGSIQPLNGLMEKRGGALIDIDQAKLSARMRAYFDPGHDFDTLLSGGHPLCVDAARFEARTARPKILAAETYDPANVVRYMIRPFDDRFAYYCKTRPLWNEPRPKLWDQFNKKNAFIVSRPARVAEPEGIPIVYTSCLGDNDALRGHAYYMPIHIVSKSDGFLPEELKANLSERMKDYLVKIGFPASEIESVAGPLPWMHALAVVAAPKYLEENQGELQGNWPRVPLPSTRAGLEASAALGARLAALLDTETAVDGVDAFPLDPLYLPFGVISRAGGGVLRAADLAVTAGWGRADTNGVMPGRGRLTARAAYDPATEAAIRKALANAALPATLLDRLGPPVDVHLNEAAYWADVPTAVWDYRIGGYQVIKKWLSYRERSVLGRDLTMDELEYVTAMVRRLTAIILMEPALDANYRKAGSDAFAWTAAS